MDKRFSFNADAVKYDKFRPRYCKELFDDIMRYSDIKKDSKALEIGIGTGQATKPFLDIGCKVEGVELGDNMARFVFERYKGYEGFSVKNCSFEDYNGRVGSFDIVYSATAFHWIPENIGFNKVYSLLKNNGTVALFWNRPFAAKADDPLHCEIQRIYSVYRPSENKPVENNEKIFAKIIESLNVYGFSDVQMKLYHKTRTFDSDDYISLLNTYSDHMALDEDVRLKLERELKAAIISFGNTITVYDNMDLYLARK